MLSYTKMISRLDSFDKLISENKINLTCTNRSVKEYNELLGTDLKKLILEQAKKHGKKINVLDAGCGEGSAIRELLSDPELNHAIATCTGVSKSYFDAIKQLSQQHGDRFVYYIGEVQDVLLKQKNQYDLILDAWGAFSYSPDKLGLLELYYKVLTPNGEAHMLSPIRSTISIKDEYSDMELSDYCLKYPDLFTYKKTPNTNAHINLIKNKIDFSFPKYKLESFEETSALDEEYDIASLRSGNALCPTKIIYKSMFTPRNEVNEIYTKIPCLLPSAYFIC